MRLLGVLPVTFCLEHRIRCGYEFCMSITRKILCLTLVVFGLAYRSLFAADVPVETKVEFALPAIGEEVPLPRIKAICEHYHLEELWRKIERDPPVRPFKSDGCTGWVNEWKGISIYPAGFLHDLKYWAGYPGEDVARLVADAELMMDVARLLNFTAMAETMFHGVRVAGGEQLNASFSWGFGRKKTAAEPGK